jgi:hypothetical protein
MKKWRSDSAEDEDMTHETVAFLWRWRWKHDSWNSGALLRLKIKDLYLETVVRAFYFNAQDKDMNH